MKVSSYFKVFLEFLKKKKGTVTLKIFKISKSPTADLL